MGISEFQLKNGLKVLLAQNHTAPVVTYMQLFRVGSRDEGVGHTGATHFLEHMMFKGTKKFDPRKGLDSTELLNRIGAVSNATTWFDRTNYFEAVPSEYLEFCVKMEADRMRNLQLREEDRNAEMSVVRNELERGENSPDEAMEKEMYAIAYREHPYHHPTIGWRTDVESVPMSRLKQFYDDFYWPNNCTVLAVGDFEISHILKLIHKYYGKIPSSPEPIPQVYTEEPPQEGERRYQIRRAGDLCRVWIGHRTPSSQSEDHYPLNVISHILGGSHDRGSRLYKALIDSGLAMDAACRHDELRDPALMIIAATLTPATNPADVERVVVEELDKLCKERVSEEELSPIKSANRKGSILARADQMELAFAIGEAEARADWRWLSEFDEKFEAVSADDIMRVAQLYFISDNRTVGTFLPIQNDEEEYGLDEDSDEESAEISAKVQKNGRHKKIPRLSAMELEKILSPGKRTAKASLSSQAFEERLENGLTLIHLPNPGTGSVAVALYLAAGNYYEPANKHGLADVVTDMLMRGTQGISKEQLALILKEIGLVEGLSLHADSFAVNCGSTVVAEDLKTYLQTVAKVLREPVFLEQELEKLKLEWAARIAEQKNNTGPMATNRLYAELYPEGHLFHQKDFDQQLEELSSMQVNDLGSFHKKYSPDGAILTIVGDIESARALELAKETFGNWSGTHPSPVELANVPVPEQGRKIEINLPDKSSMDILMGYPLPVKRSDPEFYPLYLASLALGGDTITSRLGKVIREQHGLTYGVHSRLGDNSYGTAPWTIDLSVNPQNVTKAMTLVEEVLNNYKKKGISTDELKREAGGAAGIYTVSMRSSLGIAKILTRFKALGMGIEGADKHAERILSVKKAQVDEIIDKFLHPDRFLTVIAGTFQ